MTTIVRAQVAHTPSNPFLEPAALELFEDGGPGFEGQKVVASKSFAGRVVRPQGAG